MKCLRICHDCPRHVVVTERACPFCKTALVLAQGTCPRSGAGLNLRRYASQVGNRALTILMLGACFALAAAGCGNDEEGIDAEYEQEVARSNACTTVRDCVVIEPGCPLGCWSAVSKDDAARVKRVARELIDEYSGNPCVYDCNIPEPLQCVAKKCVLPEREVRDAGAERDANP